VSVGICFFGLREIRIEILGFNRGSSYASAALIDHIALHAAGGNL
jgi:hypothetical protein